MERQRVIQNLEQIRNDTLQQFDNILRFFSLMSIAEEIVWRYLPHILEKSLLYASSNLPKEKRAEIEEWVASSDHNKDKLSDSTAFLYADFMLRLSDVLKSLSLDLYENWCLSMEYDRKHLKGNPRLLHDMLLQQSLVLGVSALEDSFTQVVDIMVPLFNWSKPKGCLFGTILNHYAPKLLDTSDEPFKELFDSIREVIATRNLLVHNEAKVNHKYVNSFPDSGFSVEDTRRVDDKYLSKALLHMKAFIITIVDCAVSSIKHQSNNI